MCNKSREGGKGEGEGGREGEGLEGGKEKGWRVD